MAAQTHGAVDSLLGLLSSAIKDEARLLGGVHGDVQFIKDEMDSMNGFLLHLTKTEGEHDDQLRAWMKQVRDIAYIAEDCIELYVRDLAPPDEGMLAFLRHLPVYIWTAPARHRLATQIRELKVRVRDVGERRLRYGVTVPTAPELRRAVKLPGQDEIVEEARREAFLQALNKEVVMLHSGGLASEEAGTIKMQSRAIGMLPAGLPSKTNTILAILNKYYRDDAELSITKMFLCALFVYPYITMQELKNLKDKLEEGADEPKELVRTFCYSMLSTQQKSCLQYLTAFLEETSISRTSLVRRWAAEGIVVKEHEMTPEEVGERCFSDLVFRGFVRPVRIGDAGTVKSCVMDDSIRVFITNISKSENFVSELPSHLDRQLKIRKIVLRSRPEQQKTDGWRNMNIHDLVRCCGGRTSRMPQEDDTIATNDIAAASDVKDPMDDLVDFLKSLPELYRLNVLDLGGCKGLKKRHLKSICKVISLKYLSLRNTDVSRLRPRHIQALRILETLDIRGTNVLPGDMKHIFLPKLKHLLAGRYVTVSGGDASTARTSTKLWLATVDAPKRIGMMRYIETLCHVKVSKDGNELEGVAKLQQLRKLGVIVSHVNETTAKLLRRVINSGLALRSLSIWVADGQSVTLDISKKETSFSPSSLILENLDIVGKCSLPPWIEEVKKLANVTLRETQLKDDDLLRLGRLHGLRCLRLRGGSYAERALLNFTGGQFQALKFLVVRGDKITSIAFAPDAAPMLEKIVWIFQLMDKEKQEPLSGISHLVHLKVIDLKGDHFDPLHLANLEQAVAAHPNQPTFRYSFSDKVFEDAGDVTVTA